MTFQPVVPFGGVAGWAFLERTREAQQNTFDNSATIVRDTEYFEQSIDKINTAEELVSDRRLLRVALGAFGLDDDIDNRFFIQKVLEGSISDQESLPNRLADKRYFAMAEAFGFGDLVPPNTAINTFGSEITSQFRERQFEIEVGEQSTDMRLALGVERNLNDLNSRDLSEDAAWYTVMANQSLRTVFERALSLPEFLGTIDVERQLEVFQDRARSVFGESSLNQFEDPEKLEDLRKKFLAQSELESGALSTTARGSAALTLLQSTSLY